MVSQKLLAVVETSPLQAGIGTGIHLLSKSNSTFGLETVVSIGQVVIKDTRPINENPETKIHALSLFSMSQSLRKKGTGKAPIWRKPTGSQWAPSYIEYLGWDRNKTTESLLKRLQRKRGIIRKRKGKISK